MRIKAASVPEGHSIRTGTVDIDPEKSGDIQFARPVECIVEIDRIQSRIQFRIAYRGIARLICSRCVKTFDYPISGDCALLVNVSPEQGIAIVGDEEYAESSIYTENQEIDVAPLVTDEIVTAMPMKPLCSEQCNGVPLESKGKRADEKGKAEKEIDPRWNALKKLKDKPEP
jgi:uncharacterized protein